MIKRVLASVMLAVIAVILLPMPILANDEPDDVVLSDIKIFEDLITDGDFLAVVPYYIPFTALPDEPISRTFIFRMLSSDGATEIGSNLAYPYHDLGYGSGMVQFYITENTTWEEAYIFRVQENPTYYPTPLYWDFTVGPINYSTAADQAADLKSTIIGIATELSAEYGVNLLYTTDEGDIRLSTYGEIYFQNAIPGLSTMCVNLFSVQIRSPDYTRRTWSYTISDALRTKYSGTFVDEFMTGFAGLFSMNTPTAMNFVSIVLFVILMLVGVWKFKASTYSALMDGYTLLILLMLMGFFDMVLAGFIAFVLVLVGGAILLLNRS